MCSDEMELLSLFFALSYGIMHISSNDVSGQEVSELIMVQLGENITLMCNTTNRYEIAWYHQQSEHIKLLISAEIEKISERKILLLAYNQNWKRLKVEADVGFTTVSLIITGLTDSDLGLYLCGTKADTPEMHFETPVRLQLEENLKEDKGDSGRKLPVEKVEITDDLTVKERVLMYGGVGMAILMFFLSTVAAGVVIYHRGRQNGWTAGKDAAAL
ncbi:uncharacterized protein LOC127650460 [Xyrauchen texanus]|uniref:uncharacterized protein LOC127650460 n=1 Tax=Xyrauchen texanus TaxID=154827 RepID=UPI00224217D7|nr:uncharacterized protein LOC127650460 [Xyrauchen texanus]